MHDFHSDEVRIHNTPSIQFPLKTSLRVGGLCVMTTREAQFSHHRLLPEKVPSTVYMGFNLVSPVLHENKKRLFGAILLVIYMTTSSTGLSAKPSIPSGQHLSAEDLCTHHIRYKSNVLKFESIERKSNKEKSKIRENNWMWIHISFVPKNM